MLYRSRTFGTNNISDGNHLNIFDFIQEALIAFMDTNLLILCLISTISLSLGLILNNYIMIFDGTSILFICLYVTIFNS